MVVDSNKVCYLFYTHIIFGIIVTQSQNKKPEIRPNFSGSHTFSLTASAEIGPDTNSLTFVLVTARFWLKCDWLLEQCHKI